jgi:hypothetical protein
VLPGINLDKALALADTIVDQELAAKSRCERPSGPRLAPTLSTLSSRILLRPL